MKIKNTAFTLIELLVVILIIGILATISVSTFQGYFEKARLAKSQAMATQIQRLFMTENASTEENLFSAWYSFDGPGDVNTSSPYIIDKLGHNNLTNKSSGTTYGADDDTPLKIGKSLRIDKVHLFGASGPDWPKNKITMAFWVKVSNFNSFMTYPFWLYAKNLFRVYEDGKVRFGVYTGAVALSEPGLVKKDKWHYIVGSYENEIVRLFVDGELVAINENASVPDNYFSANLILGYASGGYAFDGYLDDVMLINKGFDGKELK